MKTTITFIGTLLIAVALGGLAYVAYLGVQSYQQSVRNQALADCLQSSSVSWTKNTTNKDEQANTVTEPNRYWVTICMKEMGYEFKTELK